MRGHLILVRVPDAQADEGLSIVFRVSVKTTYVLHSLIRGAWPPTGH